MLLQCARMLDSETYKIALEDLESRLNLTGFENHTIGGEGFSFALMANHHKPQRPPSDNVDDHKNVDYGARRTVDKRGNCHAEHNAEKYFSTGKEERVPGFAHRPTSPTTQLTLTLTWRKDVRHKRNPRNLPVTFLRTRESTEIRFLSLRELLLAKERLSRWISV